MAKRDLIGYGWIMKEYDLRSSIRKFQDFDKHYLVESQADLKREQRSENAFERYKPVWSKALRDVYDGYTIVNHLMYAIKNESFDIHLIKRVFESLDRKEQKQFFSLVKSQLRNEDVRRAAYLYEVLLQEEIPIKADALKKVSYAELFDCSKYYTSSRKDRLDAKFRINDNSLGHLQIFSPVLSRYQNPIKSGFELGKRYRQVCDAYPQEVKSECARWLAYSETRSSLGIENIDANSGVVNRHIELLELLDKTGEDKGYSREQIDNITRGLPELTEELLAWLQREMSDREEKYEYGFREGQNFIATNLPGGGVVLNHLCPPPGALGELMEVMDDIYKDVTSAQSDVDPLAAAALVSGAFVMIHPFNDGNGRLSRYLFHSVLARRNFTEKRLIFPVSEAINLFKEQYYSALGDIFSPILSQAKYTIDSDTHKIVSQTNNLDIYRYPDFSGFSDFMYKCVDYCTDKVIPEMFEVTQKQLLMRKSTGGMGEKMEDYFYKRHAAAAAPQAEHRADDGMEEVKER